MYVYLRGSFPFALLEWMGYPFYLSQPAPCALSSPTCAAPSFCHESSTFSQLRTYSFPLNILAVTKFSLNIAPFPSHHAFFFFRAKLVNDALYCLYIAHLPLRQRQCETYFVISPKLFLVKHQ